MAKYGVFENGQCIQRGFTVRADADRRAARLRRLEPGSEFEVEEMCPIHPDGQDTKTGCEECWA